MEDKQCIKLIMLVSDKTISYMDGSINMEALNRISLILSDIKNSGINVSLVSAGAILMGVRLLNIKERPETLSKKQAIAAVGQVELIKCYQELFGNYGQHVAQVLLTRKMINQKQYGDNLKLTINELFNLNIIPVINENDSVSTDDIELEDNYPLAVKLADTIDAEIMIIASDIKNKYHIITKSSPIAYTAGSHDDVLNYIKTIHIDTAGKDLFPKSRHDILINNETIA